jgi:hypothetical protein
MPLDTVTTSLSTSTTAVPQWEINTGNEWIPNSSMLVDGWMDGWMGE